MDVVVKEGSLFLQGLKFGKKIWRKTWVVLFEPSLAGVGRVEMYDLRDGGLTTPLKPDALKKADKRVIRLAECLSITPAPGVTCPTECSAFYLNTTQRTYTLAGPKMDEWVPILCQLAFQKNEGSSDSKKTQKNVGGSMSENDLYSTWSPGQYQVTVQMSEAAIRCRMSGSYLLSPEKESLCLLDLKTGQTVFNWPYRFLRRFGQIKEGISIEAGRRCQTGEGHFTFLSKHGSHIYRAIEEAIMHQSVQDLLSKATSQMQDLTAQQLPQRPLEDARPRGVHGSPSRGMQGKPCPALPRRNLALPAPPTLPQIPTPPQPPPLSSKPSAASVKPPSVFVKPPAVVVRPPPVVVRPPPVVVRPPPDDVRPPPVVDRPPAVASRSKPPTSTTEEVIYATIKPHLKTRVKQATSPDIPRPPEIPSYSPSIPRKNQDPEKETKDPYASVEDPDADYCNWNQGAIVQQDVPNTEGVYSIVVHPHRYKDKDSTEASQDQASTSPVPHTVNPSEIPVNFKQALSNILFKDLTRTTPRPFGGSSDHLANLDMEMDDLDYCEIQN
ncbi:docking protein 3 [Hoplias malabaricus]|uniref:docking protein 3 n=1 Tax=Hoplias malabaricus TaxID=27720 RepID=UPI0034626B2F